ncbi:hypothetical protein FJQ98_25045 [Lysinibacillus agricola]|uniref:RNA-binding S4 domain-containing protein n=1 Tax=Lysinibacillus agricola TaxID=2590012 RepID=A0ABX7AQT5_9BACI|nr:MULTISPECIES: hypothetical protein [Lysinibacillus]KOS61666.1 hypothetical protein AN161_16930 [Lysinibacillus sp. FJAT-14222]QQP12316.1 hypothetical protein FJQ98_25045 [Lysinibacillus agricola]
MFLKPEEQLEIIQKGVDKIVNEGEMLAKFDHSSKKQIPDNIPSMLIEIGKESVLDIIPSLIAKNYIKSKSEFMRLIKQNDVSLNGGKLTVDDTDKILMNEEVLQIGKKRFIRFIK